MKRDFFRSVGYFLSGDMVRDATERAIDGFIEKRAEPRYRRKATEDGFVDVFDKQLSELRNRGAIHASLRAYNIAREMHLRP